MRARQIERRDADTAEAVYRVQRSRETNRGIFNDRHQTRPASLPVVLLHDSKLETSFSHKLVFRWLRPYRTKTALVNGSYKLEGLEGTEFRLPVHGNRLKAFHMNHDAQSAEPAENTPSEPDPHLPEEVFESSSDSATSNDGDNEAGQPLGVRAACSPETGRGGVFRLKTASLSLRITPIFEDGGPRDIILVLSFCYYPSRETIYSGFSHPLPLSPFFSPH